MTITANQKNTNSVQDKVNYFDQVLSSQKGINTTVIAKEHNMSAQKLNSILHSKRIIYKTQKTWVLYSKYENKGYQDTFTSLDGRIQNLWTQKGRLFIHDVLTGKLLIPTIITEEKYHQITMEEILNHDC